MPYKDKNSEAAIASNRRNSLNYYYKNKEKQLARNKTKKQSLADFRSAYKEERGCMDCGGKFPAYVLDLDHRDPSIKSFTPSKLHSQSSWTKMNEELAKCDVVCANCHRIRTHENKHHLIRKELVHED
jgi:hypothetical protein